MGNTLFGRRFSPIDSETWGNDPSAPDCWCTDSHLANGTAVDYCPQHGDDPDFTLAADPDAARRWRTEQAGGDTK